MKNNYICHLSCLRNSIAYDDNFLYTSVNNNFSRHFFLFFFYSNFGSLGSYRGEVGVRGQKIAQIEKEQLHPSHAISQEQYSISWFLVHLCKMMKKKIFLSPYFRNHASYDYHLWYSCKMIISLGIFFYFLKILIIVVVLG